MNFDKLGTYKRNKVGRFDSVWAALRRFGHAFYRWSLITSAAVALVAIGSVVGSTSIVTATTTDSFPVKIEALKADLVSRLSQCESGGITDGLVTFDPDKSGKRRNLPSFGVMQFKVPTVVQYVKQLRGDQLTDQQAIVLALNAEQAKALATQVIFDVDGGIWNWKNCTDKLGLNAEATAIKKLLK